MNARGPRNSILEHATSKKLRVDTRMLGHNPKVDPKEVGAAVLIASRFGYKAALNELLQLLHLDINFADSNRETALIYWAARGDA